MISSSPYIRHLELRSRAPLILSNSKVISHSFFSTNPNAELFAFNVNFIDVSATELLITTVVITSCFVQGPQITGIESNLKSIANVTTLDKGFSC